MATRLPWALLVALLVIASAATASAQDDYEMGGAYMALGGFFIIPMDSEFDVKDDPILSALDLEARSKNGFGGFFALGLVLGGGRLEVEAAYRANDLDELREPSGVSTPIEGQITAMSVMGNGYLDFHEDDSSVSPYLGVGAGMARLEISDFGIGGPGDGEAKDTVFAYQGMAGLASHLSERITLFAGYRYFATVNADLDGVEISYGTHNVEVGLRLAF